jgi:hypothetical protein
MKNNILKKNCKCCGKEFDTTRIDQFFVNRQHQIAFNNFKQSLRRRKLGKINNAISVTYSIYNELLGLRSLRRKSKEFLKGMGANIAVHTHTEEIDGVFYQFLYDIQIIDDKNDLILKRKKNG